mgnify:CR=1 FL=1
MLKRFFYYLRNLRYKKIFTVLCKYSKGNVLDVGGWDFYLTVLKKNVPFDHWTVIESDPGHLAKTDNHRISIEQMDGCNMSYDDNKFDTTVCIQVAEHVFTPQQLFEENVRVLKKGGYGIFMVPQTSNLHGTPNHYQNFTRFWCIEVCRRCNVELIKCYPLGGTWSSMASRLLHTPFQILKNSLFTYTEAKRNFIFYLLLPLAVIFIVLAFPTTLLLSLGDIEEEANNHLFVFRK